MTEISQSQLRREAVEIALWATPSPRPDISKIPELAPRDDTSIDQAVGNNAAGDGTVLPDLGPLSSFGSWESVASTIVHKAESLSGFNPGATDFDIVIWNEYLRKFSTMPFILGFNATNRTASISSLSLDKGVDAVEDLIKNIMTPANFEGVVTAIKKIAQLALENKGKTQKESNQQAGVLSRHEKRLYLGAVRTAVEMEYKSGKGYEQLTQTLTVYRGYGELDFDKCKRSANTLLEWDRRNVDEWVDDTASAPKKPNESPAWNK
ncbi:hypothetical protein [Streptomyces sp. BE303]|uniref:hypothetical protein n=1 Tax=Streptomyces sp. BE303 TaxID=3002528 RepID=UPI002E798B81|nr:hypothetical protein [Streptomyces sp. BE303]MED7949758.1 hypothetical protein [Streptomyces sp. BE303]